jgi:hypothetical protein
MSAMNLRRMEKPIGFGKRGAILRQAAGINGNLNACVMRASRSPE